MFELYACQHFSFDDKYYSKETNFKYFLILKLCSFCRVYLGNGVLTFFFFLANSVFLISSFKFYYTNNRIHSLKHVHVIQVALSNTYYVTKHLSWRWNINKNSWCGIRYKHTYIFM